MATRASRWYTILAACAYALICPALAFAGDTLLVHGHIYTGNPQMPWAESLAISGTRIDAIGTDKACTWPPDPFVGIEATVTRKVWRSADTAGIAGNPLDGAAQGGAVPTGAAYVPQERITVADAIRAYTQGSAYTSFADARVGTLKVGKEADLVVLSQNPFAVPPQAIAQTKVVTTIVAGKIVYSRSP